MVEIEYEITHMAKIATGGLHVEFNFENPVDKNTVHLQMNFGEDMRLNDIWKSHLETYIKGQIKQYKDAANPDIPDDDYSQFMGKKKIKEGST